MKKLKSYLPLLFIVGCSVLAWSLGLQKYINFDTFREHQMTIELFIEDSYIPALLIFSLIYITLVGLSIPGATIMTVTGGFLFGQAVGTGLAVVSATLGASLFFLSARLASQSILASKAGIWVKKMQDGFHENAFSYMITLRLIPIFPFVAINLAAAILQVPLKTFFFGTLFGIIPGSFVFVSIGVALHEVIDQPGFTPDIILDRHILLALIGLGVLSLLPVLYKKLKKKS